MHRSHSFWYWRHSKLVATVCEVMLEFSLYLAHHSKLRVRKAFQKMAARVTARAPLIPRRNRPHQRGRRTEAHQLSGHGCDTVGRERCTVKHTFAYKSPRTQTLSKRTSTWQAFQSPPRRSPRTCTLSSSCSPPLSVQRATCNPPNPSPRSSLPALLYIHHQLIPFASSPATSNQSPDFHRRKQARP